MAEQTYHRRMEAARKVEEALRTEGKPFEADRIAELRRTCSSLRSLVVKQAADLAEARGHV
jgi:hypothetical protein